MKGKKTEEERKTSKNKSVTLKKQDESKKYKTDVMKCLVDALLIEIYFISLNAIDKFVKTQFDMYVKIFYMIYIFIAIIMFELSYKKGKKNYAITGIECILLAIHTLFIGRGINNIEGNYILITSCIWPIYYCLKALIIYTNENRKRLKQISDISEIVKEEKPIKKVAKKRKK